MVQLVNDANVLDNYDVIHCVNAKLSPAEPSIVLRTQTMCNMVCLAIAIGASTLTDLATLVPIG